MNPIKEETIENVKKFASESPRNVSEGFFRAVSNISKFLSGEAKSFDLGTLFEVQMGLNDLIFYKSNLKATDGTLLSVEKLRTLAKTRPATASSDSIEWVRRFVRALKDETRELEDELVWKWWSKDTADVQNIDVEIADHLFFLICIAQARGLTGADLFSLYMQKAVVNIERQFGNYSKATKDESDNKAIGVSA